LTTASDSSARRWLWLALAATLLFRFWLAAAAPVTADEAYFILWGREPALGYYDHPPMVGWWLAPLVALSEAPWLMRLPAVLVPPLVALGVGAALQRWFGRDADTSALAALAVLLVPMNFWNVLITTDTPLVLFSVASLLLFARAAQRDAAALYFASGVLLGLAFLSKYFAVLLGLAYLVWAVLSRRPRAFLLVFLGGLPAGLLNLYWNYDACWCNVMFNAINRHDEDGGWSARTPLLYAAALAYLAAPLLWFAWRGRGRLREAWRRPEERVLLVAWLAPLAVFALLSPVKRIGLHWLLSFLPALVLSAARWCARRRCSASSRCFRLWQSWRPRCCPRALGNPLRRAWCSRDASPSCCKRRRCPPGRCWRRTATLPGRCWPTMRAGRCRCSASAPRTRATTTSAPTGARWPARMW
jgi:4-amino-4-deoxy-L-arabinose transferase-like glycosyltransferase